MCPKIRRYYDTKEQIVESNEFGISLSTAKIARQAGGAVFVKMRKRLYSVLPVMLVCQRGLDFFP